jgi:hypothetical protein
MPEKRTIQRAVKARKAGKAPSTQAGEFVREEMEHLRKGKHGARSTKQAVAIGLSKARRAGVALKPPAKGKLSEKSQKSAEAAYTKGERKEPISKTRSLARTKALKKEPRAAASYVALSRQGRSAARSRTPEERSLATKKGAKTKGAIGRSEATRKAVRSRQK